MKKQLIAGMLAFATTIASHAEQPSKAELLVRLKQAKGDALTTLNNNKESITKILHGYIDWTQTGFDLMIRLWSDLFCALDPKEKQFDADAAICLHLLCETQDNIGDIFNKVPENGMGKILSTIMEVMTSHNKNLNNEEIKNNYKAVISVFMKYMEYPDNNDYLNDPVLAKEIESCLICGDFWCIGSITIYETKVLEKLLPKLDAKITELETQA